MNLSDIYALFLDGITVGMFLGAIVFTIFSFIHWVYALMKNI